MLCKVRYSPELGENADRDWHGWENWGCLAGAVVAKQRPFITPSLCNPSLSSPAFSPKAPLISWNLINREPFCELVYWAVATTAREQNGRLCAVFLCLPLSPSLHPYLSLSLSFSLLHGNKLGSGIRLTGWGVEVVEGPRVAFPSSLWRASTFLSCSPCLCGPLQPKTCPAEPPPSFHTPLVGAVW